MTDKEKKALKDAFGIPEPDRKQEFIALFGQRMGDKKKKRIPPFAIRIAAAAAMLTAVTGVLTNMPHSPEKMGTYDNITTTTAALTTINKDNNAVTTASDNNSDNMTTVTASAVTSHISETTAALSGNNTVKTKASSSGQRHTTAASRTNRPSSGTSATSSVNVSTSRSSVRSSTTSKPASTTRSSTTSITASATPTMPTTVNYIPYGRDLTVSPSKTYTVGSDVIDYRKLIPQKNDHEKGVDDNNSDNIDNPLPSKTTIDLMFDNSYAVVLAKIDKIVYTSISGRPYTVENIIISDTLKGTLRNYDMISLYVSGGYMPADEYAQSHPDVIIDNAEGLTVYDDGGCKGEQSVGDTLLFFISNNNTDIPQGAFSLTGEGDEAVFRYQNGKYVSISDSSYHFSANYFN